MKGICSYIPNRLATKKLKTETKDVTNAPQTRSIIVTISGQFLMVARFVKSYVA